MLQINFQRLAAGTMPSFLRNNFMVNWIGSLLGPAQRINSQLLKFKSDKERTMGFTGQTVMLQELLREDFLDPTICIENLVSTTQVQYIYRSSLKRTWPVVYGTIRRRESPYIFNTPTVNEKLAFQFEFVIHVPNDFFLVQDDALDNENEKLQNFLATVRRYKHVGVRFCLVNQNDQLIWPFIENFDQSLIAQYVKGCVE